jgi:hypothetical protein
MRRVNIDAGSFDLRSLQPIRAAGTPRGTLDSTPHHPLASGSHRGPYGTPALIYAFVLWVREDVGHEGSDRLWWVWLIVGG